MEFDFIHEGVRLGWWEELEEPWTWTHDPTFTSNFRPYTLFGLPFHVTWNGVYLQITHRNIQTTLYFHRQLAMDHARHTNQPPAKALTEQRFPAFEQAVQALEEMTIIGWFASADGASWTATINSINVPSLTKVIHVAERSFPAMNKRVAAWEYFDSTGNSEPKQTKISSKSLGPSKIQKDLWWGVFTGYSPKGLVSK